MAAVCAERCGISSDRPKYSLIVSESLGNAEKRRILDRMREYNLQMQLLH